jgi:large subunit ribosomal protein L35
MPKAKTHKGLAKRFKVTARGKVVHHRSGKSHLQSHKPRKRVRKLRKELVAPPALAAKVKAFLAPAG